MKQTERLNPLRILETLIREIGVMSPGWGVDILTAAFEYLSTPETFMKERTFTAGGLKFHMSTVDHWDRNEPRTLDGEPEKTIIWRQ